MNRVVESPLILCLESSNQPFSHRFKKFSSQIKSVQNHQQAIEAISNQSFALFIYDTQFSTGNLLEFLQNLKPRSPDTLKILLNCTFDEILLGRILEEGEVWRCLEAPFSDDRLEMEISQGLKVWTERQSPIASPLARGDLHLKIIRDITDLLNKSDNLDYTLDETVKIIGHWLHHDVVSIYLWNSHEQKLILSNTVGLYVKPEKPIKLSMEEGLTGLVFKTKKTLIATPASQHPNYIFIPEIGEEKYESYIGTPIMMGTRALGVLIAQSLKEQPISSGEEILFQFIATRLAGVVELSERVKRIPEGPGSKHASKILQGRGVGTGYAFGPVHLLRPSTSSSDFENLTAFSVETELDRLKTAIQSSILKQTDLNSRLEKEGRLSRQDLGIFKAHLQILKDSSTYTAPAQKIKDQNITAEHAVQITFQGFADVFSQHSDEYLRERALDFKDICKKIIDELLITRELKPSETELFPEGAIVISHEIRPSQVPLLYEKKVSGIITQTGGVTSHTAILAKSLGIPAILGVDHVCNSLENINSILIDSRAGLVYLSPDIGLINEYRKQFKPENEFKKFITEQSNSLVENPFGVEIDANIGFPGDVEIAKKYNLDRVGLYRTEFTFMQFLRWPTILEQFWIYEKTALHFKGPINIRTLDIGADKHLSYFKFPPEENPLLGLRSIRFSIENLDLFRDQLRAVLMGVKKGYPFRVLLPMVTHVWEIEATWEILQQTGAEMDIPVDQLPPLGVMTEVPSIIHQIDDIRPYIQFLSVGTNDLTQYLLAVDRNSNVVGHYYSSLHPAVIRTLNQLLGKAAELNLEISVCGEMAASPEGALALVALGCRRLSITPSTVPLIRYMLMKVTQKTLDEIKGAILVARNEKDIGAILRNELEKMDHRLLEWG